MVVGGSPSNTLPVLSGSHKDHAVLRPLLFLLYIDGITSITLSSNSHLTLYADDMLLYPFLTVSAHLQEDIQSGLMLITYNLTFKV